MSRREPEDSTATEPHEPKSVNRTPIGPGPETHGGRREPIDESGSDGEQALEPVGESPRPNADGGDRKPLGDETGADQALDDLYAGEGSEGFDSPTMRER